MFRHPDTPLPYSACNRRFFTFTLSALVLCAASLTCQADEGDWLVLDGSGFKIFKRFGLQEGDWLTMTLYHPVHYEPGFELERFEKFLADDLPRVETVLHYYQTEKLELAKITALFTLRRCRDFAGNRSLVFYQGFYRPGKNRMWFVRTDLNDNVTLLINHYNEELDIIFKQTAIIRQP
jgi:hypothetical protein